MKFVNGVLVCGLLSLSMSAKRARTDLMSLGSPPAKAFTT